MVSSPGLEDPRPADGSAGGARRSGALARLDAPAVASPDVAVSAPAESSASARLPRPRWRTELYLLLALYGLYSLVRNVVPDQVAQAQHNARVILGAERALGLDVEKGINLATAHLPWLAVPANYYYATLHFAITAAVLVWLYRRRPAQYARARGVLLVMTLFALVGYWLYPLAPPRLMTGGGYVDTVREYGLWGVTPSDDLVSLSNQYAAMPSMHVGWALWAGLAVALLARHRLARALGALYPALTLGVVVVTANHFILDAVAAVAIFAVAVLVVDVVGRLVVRVPEVGVERSAVA
jgi:hypothetical protein